MVGRIKRSAAPAVPTQLEGSGVASRDASAAGFRI